MELIVGSLGRGLLRDRIILKIAGKNTGILFNCVFQIGTGRILARQN